jgi:hypothetical protein
MFGFEGTFVKMPDQAPSSQPAHQLFIGSKTNPCIVVYPIQQSSLIVWKMPGAFRLYGGNYLKESQIQFQQNHANSTRTGCMYSHQLKGH